MKFIKLLSIVSIVLLYPTTILAQIDRAGKQLKSKLSVMTQLNTQLTEENKNLHSYLRQLNKVVSNVRDSLNFQTNLSKKLDLETKKWQESTFNTNKSLQEAQKDFITAQDEIRKLKYENEILKDPAVVRVYDLSAKKVKNALIARLNDSSLGFKFNETKDTLKAVKQFDNSTKALWLIDKTSDTSLELNLRVVQHLYDPNRCVVYASTNLREKGKYGNSPLKDTDKINLYQEKAIRLLEVNISKNTLK